MVSKDTVRYQWVSMEFGTQASIKRVPWCLVHTSCSQLMQLYKIAAMFMAKMICFSTAYYFGILQFRNYDILVFFMQLFCLYLVTCLYCILELKYKCRSVSVASCNKVLTTLKFTVKINQNIWQYLRFVCSSLCLPNTTELLVFCCVIITSYEQVHYEVSSKQQLWNRNMHN